MNGGIESICNEWKKMRSRRNYEILPKVGRLIDRPNRHSLGELHKRVELLTLDNDFITPFAKYPIIEQAKDLKISPKSLGRVNHVIVAPYFSSNTKGQCGNIGPFATLAEVRDVSGFSEFDSHESKKTEAFLLEGKSLCLVERIYQEKGQVFVDYRDYLIPDQKQSIKAKSTFMLFKRLVLKLMQKKTEVEPSIKKSCKSAADFETLVYLLMPYLSIDFSEKYSLFYMGTTSKKLEKAISWVNKELEVIKLSEKIEKELSEDLSESQRYYFLNEQLKAIKKELGEYEDTLDEIAEIENKIECKAIPEKHKKVFLREAEKLSMTPPGSPEYLVGFNYLELVNDLPWAKLQEREPRSIRSAKSILNRSHFGQTTVKDRIIEYLALIKHTGETNGQILLLNGPPGVGKTSLAKSIAKALNKPVTRISLGGVKDEAELRGHRRTYIGAMPGKIIQAIRYTNSSEAVIILDEIDKLGAGGVSDLNGALLEVLDPEHNQEFMDHFLSVPYDLSKVTFIATSNDADALMPALLDRMERIDISGYTEDEKVKIASKHLVPGICERYKLKESSFRLVEPTLRHIIRYYTREAGVRQLKASLEKVARKRVTQIVTSAGSFKTGPKIDLGLIERYLGKPKFLDEATFKKLPPGICTGLAYTGAGGDIMYIEVIKSPSSKDKGQLKITGSLGNVMKESVTTALSFVTANAESLSLDAKEIESHNLHIHFPDGATPKDGPSAGVGITCALTSLFRKKSIPSHIAVTGEVTLNGRVLPVGGIKEKVLAAHRYGKTQVFLPEQNLKDVTDIPKATLRGLKLIPVNHMTEVISACNLI